MQPTYAGSMFIETRKFEAIRSTVRREDGTIERGRAKLVLVEGGVAEIGMMETGKGIVPGGVRDASTHRVPDVLPSAVQVRDALELAKWSIDHQQVFEGVVAK
ncbi:MAG: hypothetical protein DRQ40_04055 [Gammaproteobacteria bacterium]|nr:MAG: hypothetical protein DRQ40_04055 [Gammaproteobacteria bacterium]